MTHLSGWTDVREIRLLLTMLLVSSACGGRYFRHADLVGADHLARELRSWGQAPLWRESVPRYRVYAYGSNSEHTYVIVVSRSARAARVLPNVREGVEIQQLTVQQSAWSHLESAAARADFWRLPTRVPSRIAGLVFHEDACIVEGFVGGEYHVVERRTTTTSVEMSAFCAMFFSLAQIEPPFSRPFMDASGIAHGVSAKELEDPSLAPRPESQPE
jgi:hypothetical protein